MYDFSMTMELKSQIMKGYPIFKQNNYSFYRNEKNGCISVRSTNIPRLQELFLNRTTQKILEKCDGSKNAEQIIQCMNRLYPDVPFENIQKDVLNSLAVLTKYQLVEWKERNPFMKVLCREAGKNRTFELLDEGDIRALLSFIKESKEEVKFINFMGKMEVYEDELFIRDLLFNFSEDFFAVKENGRIKGLITLKYHANVDSTVCSVGLLIAQDIYMKELLEGITGYSDKTCNRLMSKIKLQILESEYENQKNLIKVLKDCGFAEESKSIREYKDQNIYNFSFYYKGEEAQAC